MTTPSVSGFIRSYRTDFDWLRFCLRSLLKHGREFHQIVVAVPEADRQLAERVLGRQLSDVAAVLIGVPEHSANGYIAQQITKCHADDYCSGDFIMHFDSDCMLTEPVGLDRFFDGNLLPKLLFRPWDAAGTANIWKPITKSVLMQEPPFETMPSMPLIYHRSSHELFRRHVAAIHGRDFIKYTSRLSSLSEFNALGNFCHLFTPDAYRFVRAGSPQDDFPRPFRQFWSRGPIKVQEMEAML